MLYEKTIKKNKHLFIFMKRISSIILSLLFLYSTTIMFVEITYSFLSMSPNTSMKIVLYEILIPNLLAILAQSYCIYLLWRNK